MKTVTKQNNVVRKPQKDDRAYAERNEDPYQNQSKYAEPSTCTGCNAVFTKGGWRWAEPEANAHPRICPACQRIQDKVPAGIVRVYGDFYAQHRQEINNLVNNVEAKEKAGHPLQRIMSVNASDSEMTLELTGVHVTKAVVEALKHAYQGEAVIQFAANDGTMRAEWKR